MLPVVLSLPAAEPPPEMRLAPLPLRAPDPEDNPAMPEKVALGRLLFFDPILSTDGTVSCATCHDPQHGWADERATPLGVGGEGRGPSRLLVRHTGATPLVRNVPTVLNAGFLGLVSAVPYAPEKAPLFWDGRASGLEAQVAHPMSTASEMMGHGEKGDALAGAVDRLGKIPEYRDRFQRAFPGEAAALTLRNLSRAVAAYERSLVAGGTAVDRFLRGDEGALNPGQKRGLQLLTETGCIHCHGGPMFSDFKLHVVGLPGGERAALRTPSLRNLLHTAPYMHNGSLRTLEDVLIFYEELMDTASETLDGGDETLQPPLDPLLRHLRVGPEEFPSLLAFLEALQDREYDRSRPDAVPSGLPVGGK